MELTVFAAYRNNDAVEGRGPMILDRLFTRYNDAANYIDDQPGVQNRTARWSLLKSGDWEVRQLKVHDDYDAIGEKKIQLEALKQKALNKLTVEERKALGF